MEGWVKKIRNMTVGAAALGAVATESSKVEAGFVPINEARVCVMKNATSFKYELEGKTVEIHIPQTGDPTQGTLENGWIWEYSEDSGQKKFYLEKPDSGPGQTKVTLRCDFIS